MTDTPFTLYKLIVLYALKQSAYPLTNAQISSLFLDNGYTTYFRLQEVLSDLVDTGLIETETRHHTTYYRTSQQGEETIRFFSGDISPEIRDEITDFLRQHAYELRNTAQVTAEYQKNAERDYTVRCQVREGEMSLIELRLNVPTESTAQTVAENWKTRSQEAYALLLQILTS